MGMLIMAFEGFMQFAGTGHLVAGKVHISETKRFEYVVDEITTAHTCSVAVLLLIPRSMCLLWTAKSDAHTNKLYILSMCPRHRFYCCFVWLNVLTIAFY